MRKAIDIGSALIIVGALAGITGLHGRESAPVVSETVSPFAEFPMGQPVAVDFRVDDALLDSLSQRESADQYRDWLLFTASAGAEVEPEKLSDALFDRPAVRYGFMRAVGGLEYGEVRSVFVGEGLVVALVPASRSREERIDDLAHVADQHRKNLGELPDSLAVFEYDIDLTARTGQLARTGTVRARTLFTPESGYHEARITDLDGLSAFMESIDDVTYAQVDGTALRLGGRRQLGRSYRGIRVEDVAAIWKSEKVIQERRARFDAQIRQEEDEFNSRWTRRSYDTEAERLRLEEERDAEWASVKERVARQARSLGALEGSGFSLDPAWDFEGLAWFFRDEVEPELLSGGEERAAEIRSALEAGDVEPYFALLDAIRQAGSGELANYLLQRTYEHQFQAARYDGQLQGTEVGMVLFYTDLLAKLWALDYMDRSPDAEIPDFESIPRRPISPVYRMQLDSLSKTRLWFGPQDTGFQTAADGRTLLFERNATRVYAASASGFTPGEEAPANAQSEAFLGWWNDHYEEVARYEPEYERLNEIMKWSLLVGWLNRSGSGGLLGFLEGVPVDTTSWFPDWVRERPELRFREWPSIEFYGRGFKGSRTEALPRLNSSSYVQFGTERLLSGGVSLGSRATFAERQALSRTVSPLRRRSNLNYGAVDNVANEFRTLDGVGYRFASRGRGHSSVVVSPTDKVRFRSTYGEVARGDVERVLAKSATKLQVETTVGGKQLGTLQVSRTEGGFAVAWRGREVARAQALARQLSHGQEVGALLRADGEVAAAYRLETGEYLVSFEHSDRWVRIAPEQASTVELPPGWDARVAGYEGRPQLLSWVDDAQARSDLSRGGAVPIKEEVERTASSFPSNDYRAAAREAVSDPAAFRARGEKSFRDALTRSDRDIASGRFDRALGVLDEIDQAFRRRPEFTMRRAIAELGRDRPETAAQVLRASEAGRLLDRTRFIDEVSARLARTPAADLPDVQTVSWYTEWNDLRASGHASGHMEPIVEGDRLALHYQDDALRLRPAGNTAVAEVLNGRAALYVQDAPGLNNLDWSPGALQRTLQQVVSARPGSLGSLPRGDLAHFRPSLLSTVETPERYRLRANPAPALRTYRGYRANERCERQADAPDCPRVYVVTVE